MSTNPTNDKATMTIGELSKLTGMSASAIRFYQRRGLLPERTADAGWQRYDEDALGRLAVIELAKSAGFSLDEIVRLFDALDADPDAVPQDTPIWHGLAEAKLAEIELQLKRLVHMRRLLQDALNASYLSADRVREVPNSVGWTIQAPDSPADLFHPVEIPSSIEGLDSATTR